MQIAQDSRIFAKGAVAVIFAAQHSGQDREGYTRASAAMDALAARQPGYLGMEHGGGEDGFGITVSYWADEASARAWRDHPDHKATRDAGRARWYTSYRLHVAYIKRGYAWP
ncbi:antibiotic biosynthesis monooxygenase [Blastomonas sp.]|uniref:antibiotic biosynthesis monooxygenase family protein n=1 Tax=Blastomonas sp. TaxID=1909299 RepID=UPI0035944FD5